MGIARDYLTRGAPKRGMRTWEDVATHVIAHETAHAMDRAGGTRLSADHTRGKNGPVWREMLAATKADKTIATLFDYIKSKDAKAGPQELFAELAALKTTHRELAREHFPEGFKALDATRKEGASRVSRLQPRVVRSAEERQAGAGGEKTPVKIDSPLPDNSGEEQAPLARPAAATGSVLDSIKAAMQTPAYKNLFSALKKMTATRLRADGQPKLQDLANRLTKAFGVKDVAVFVMDRGAVIEHTSGAMAELSGNGLYVPNDNVVMRRTGMAPHETVSVLLHELGHYLERELFSKLAEDSTTRQAIQRDFAICKAKQRAAGGAATSARASRASFFRNLLMLRETLSCALEKNWRPAWARTL